VYFLAGNIIPALGNKLGGLAADLAEKAVKETAEGTKEFFLGLVGGADGYQQTYAEGYRIAGDSAITSLDYEALVRAPIQTAPLPTAAPVPFDPLAPAPFYTSEIDELGNLIVVVENPNEIPGPAFYEFAEDTMARKVGGFVQEQFLITVLPPDEVIDFFVPEGDTVVEKVKNFFLGDLGKLF